MIFFGTKAVHLKTAKSNLGICPNCSTKGSLTISVYRIHFHVFWIPIFPVWKKGIAQCSNCNKAIKENKMTDSIKLEYQNLKLQTKGPIWQFSGLTIILILILISNLGSEKYQQTKLEYINSPMRGDIYEYVVETGIYSTFKIINVSKDSLTISPNKLQTHSIIKLFKIDKEQNYSFKAYSISKDKLKRMYNDEIIMAVKRE